jgi:serine/threonine-protein phosphatase 6 catalytic subunit
MNLDSYIEQLKGAGCLPERDVRRVCEAIKEILVEESNIQPVSAPITVCGDIHG